MLPKMLYELLPYLYLSVGAYGGIVINSAIVIVGSFLLIATAILIISMRITYRRKIKQLRDKALV